MIVTVGGEPVGLGALVRRGPMNFGDDVPGWAVLPYRLHIPVDHLVAAFEPTYEQFAREALDDARRFPEDWPELAPAIAAGMPPLAALPSTLPAYLAARHGVDWTASEPSATRFVGLDVRPFGWTLLGA
ncbi:hypothetical protein GXB85_14680 [Cellulomonas sp. APG4]|uniref:hypothetical protein n=1 Tax=Cellulomonas sp. APG4 TaxID=1538656 RepID=UPI00137B1087|nr:hypothetical protein [Cellulomonas sp. APG4]NCT92187.1 hypothetical protein [Cellulomonas sp. APG4]